MLTVYKCIPSFTCITINHLLSRDIFGFSSFFLRTESMRILSCLKITAIFTGACGETPHWTTLIRAWACV